MTENAPKMRIPQQRIAQRVDELMGQKEYLKAENTLKYWIEEALYQHDMGGLLAVRNEMMGFYRKIGRRDEAYQAAQQALDLMASLDFQSTESGATTYINAATVYTAFGEPARGLELFEKARAVYEAGGSKNQFKLASLCNNMATALSALERYDEALNLYEKAVGLLADCPYGQLEQAMTYLNILDAKLAEKGELTQQEAFAYLQKAQDCLDEPSLPRNDYYAFVAGKCMPSFEYYNWTIYAAVLKERVEEINERNAAG